MPTLFHRSRFVLAAATLLAAALVSVPPAQADTTFVVDVVADDAALSACTLAPGDCSLRGAVAAANATDGADTIDFLIPAAQCPGGVCPITLTDGPLTLTEAVTIDATTQVQNSGPQANVCATATEPSHMRIEVLVEPTAGETNGFIIDHADGSSSIRGFAFGISSNVGERRAISTLDGSGHHIACNHFGLNAAGSSQLGTDSFGIHVLIERLAGGVIVGTDGDGVDDVGERNVFGPASQAVNINGNHNTRISGNYIGFTADGTTVVAAGTIFMRQTSSNNLIGSDRDGISDDIETNYMRGNTPIYMYPASYTTTNNRIIGNVIGMSPTGTPAPVERAIRIEGFEALDTGYEISDNVIVSALTAAISVTGTGSGLVIDGNVIGQASDGTPGANEIGIRLDGSVSLPVSNNLIANSVTTGVQLSGTASFAAGSTGNCITDNTDGVSNLTGSSVTFEDNWWNAVDGPSGAGSGSGDTVSADVDFTPWLTNPPTACNTAPVVDGASFTVAEDAPVATAVGSVTASDDGPTLQYSVTAGNDAGMFAIDATTGEITTAAVLDFETTPSYSLTVEASDGMLAGTATIEIAVANVAPVVTDASFSMREDEAVGGTVGYVTATDVGATLEYSITGGNTGGAFAADPATGEITTADALDYLAMPSYSLTVAASDGLLTGTGTIDIAVTDVARFEDVPMTHTFYDDIEWLAWKGITKGCNPPHVTHFCPDESVTRGQMAAFLHRALGDTLTQGATVSFTDDDGSTFEADIEWLGSVGVTRGCNPPVNDQFCPDNTVTRAQMAAFMVRALDYTAGAGSDQFSDDDGSVFEADIERLAAAGVTKGCNPPGNDLFCPTTAVTRAQMAAFLHRALGG